MPDLPLHDLEPRIRERAYHLWEHAGRPDGGAEAFWHEARRIEKEAGVDAASMDSFPASDPPALGGITGPGRA